MSTAYALEHAFAVQLANVPLGSFSECTGLAAERETYRHPEGGQNAFVHTLLGRLTYPNVTLKGGVTDQTVLLDWVVQAGRKDVTVIFYARPGVALRRFELTDAVPVRWSGPTASAGANAVASESLEIAHRGLFR
jgi:phage tail-like protein